MRFFDRISKGGFVPAVTGRHRIMRLLSVLVMLITLIVVYQTVPAYYEDGLSGREWQTIALLSACILTALNFYMYGRKRDATAPGSKRRSLGGSTREFFYETQRCSKCSRKRIPVILPAKKGAQPIPVPPGATLGKQTVVYYCTNCKDYREKSACRKDALQSARVEASSRTSIRSETRGIREYRLTRQFRKQSAQVAFVLLLIFALSIYLASKNWILLILMWIAAYLFFVSLFNAVNNHMLCYQVLTKGLLQRGLLGYRLFPWPSVFAVLPLPPYETNKSLAFYTDLENLVLSPIIEDYETLQGEILSRCPHAERSLPPERQGKSA
jgi:hypothetical protein